MLWQDRQLAMPYARRPVDRVRDRGSRRVDDDLADRLRAERARGLIGMLELNADVAHIEARGQTVGEQARLADSALGRAGHVLHERVPDALHDAALDLDARERRVDGNAAVDHGIEVEHLDCAGLAIELDFRHAHHERRRGHRGRMHRGCLRQLAAVALALLGDGGKGNRLARALADHTTIFEGEFVRRAPEDLGRNGTEALLQLCARLLDSHTGDIRCRRGIRAGIVGRGVRVGTEHRYVVHRAFHMLGDHLRQDGVTACSHVGRADDQHIGPVIVQPDGDRPRIDAGDARALHGHAHARSANLAVAHVAHGVLRFPVEHVAAVV